MAYRKVKRWKIEFTVDAHWDGVEDTIEGVAKVPASTSKLALLKFKKEFGTRYKVTEITLI